MLAFGVPSSSFSTIVPVVAVYFTSCPPIFTECFVITALSSSGFLSSLGFSAALSAGFSVGCCAIAPPTPEQRQKAVNKIRSRVDMIETLTQTLLWQDCAREIVCDPATRVNLTLLCYTLHSTCDRLAGSSRSPSASRLLSSSPSSLPPKKTNCRIQKRSTNFNPPPNPFSKRSTFPGQAARSCRGAKSLGVAASAKPTSLRIATSPATQNFASAPSAKLSSHSLCSNSKRKAASISNPACKMSRQKFPSTIPGKPPIPSA